MSTLAVVPVKRFSAAKTRLDTVLDAAERHDLAQRLATGVVRAVSTALGTPNVLVVGDPELADWAGGLGVELLVGPAGLNPAVTAARDLARARGRERIAVVHADLPRPTSVAAILTATDQCLVADRHGRGTNVLALDTRADFHFAYGPDSCAAHLAEFARLGLDVRVVHDADLAWDLDDPEDLVAEPVTTRT
jgi:2-phospho-L-lactate guanylyltransferase